MGELPLADSEAGPRVALGAAAVNNGLSDLRGATELVSEASEAAGCAVVDTGAVGRGASDCFERLGAGEGRAGCTFGAGAAERPSAVFAGSGVSDFAVVGRIGEGLVDLCPTAAFAPAAFGAPSDALERTCGAFGTTEGVPSSATSLGICRSGTQSAMPVCQNKVVILTNPLATARRRIIFRQSKRFSAGQSGKPRVRGNILAGSRLFRGL